MKPIAGVDKGSYTFPKCISPEVNIIKRQDFEHAYSDIAVQLFRHYATVIISPVLYFHFHYWFTYFLNSKML